MGYTPTREVFERVIDALSFDLNAGAIRYGHDDVNDGLEPLESEVEAVVRFDGMAYNTIFSLLEAQRTGAFVLVGIGNPQGSGPFGSLGEPMTLEMPIEIVLTQVFGGADTFTDDPFLLDDLMDDVFRSFHKRRRSPSLFGTQSIVLGTVGKVENEPNWYARAISAVTRRDIRKITS